MALTRAPENESENQDISLETTFTLGLAGHIDMFFFLCFWLKSLVSAYCSGECCFLLNHSLACEIFFVVKPRSRIHIINSLLAANCMCMWVSTFSTTVPEKTKENRANQWKHNFYKRWRHKSRHRGMLQSSSKENHNTFRTTPQEHWWIWPGCPRHAQVNN